MLISPHLHGWEMCILMGCEFDSSFSVRATLRPNRQYLQLSGFVEKFKHKRKSKKKVYFSNSTSNSLLPSFRKDRPLEIFSKLQRQILRK